MYYEEKVVNGVLCWRGSPDGEWHPISQTELTMRLVTSTESAYQLLEVCESVVAEHEKGTNEVPIWLVNSARAAIAKAKGDA